MAVHHAASGRITQHAADVPELVAEPIRTHFQVLEDVVPTVLRGRKGQVRVCWLVLAGAGPCCQVRVCMLVWE